MLREMIAELKEALVDKKAPFGVDLLLPQVGEGARKTNVSSSDVIHAGGKAMKMGGKRETEVCFGEMLTCCVNAV